MNYQQKNISMEVVYAQLVKILLNNFNIVS